MLSAILVAPRGYEGFIFKAEQFLQEQDHRVLTQPHPELSDVERLIYWLEGIKAGADTAMFLEGYGEDFAAKHLMRICLGLIGIQIITEVNEDDSHCCSS